MFAFVMFFFHIQPVVINVTTSVSFPARTMKAMI
jgi:hypothetical protein